MAGKLQEKNAGLILKAFDTLFNQARLRRG
jgi:hypothetical protein